MMKDRIDINLAICAATTMLLVVSHIVVNEKFVDLQTDEEIKLHLREFDVSVRLKEEEAEKLIASVWFSRIKSSSTISNLLLSVDSLRLTEIKTYSRVQNWDVISYPNFASIPDSSKHLSIDLNPYCAFDHVFMLDTINKKRFETVFKLSVTQNDTIKSLEQKTVFKRVHELDFKAWAHEDVSIVLIPVFGLLHLFYL